MAHSVLLTEAVELLFFVRSDYDIRAMMIAIFSKSSLSVLAAGQNKNMKFLWPQTMVDRRVIYITLKVLCFAVLWMENETAA